MRVKRWIAADGSQAGYSFHCPGCNERHSLKTEPSGWGFNGSAERPTFMPSVLVQSGCNSPRKQPGDDCWCTYNAELRAKGQPESRYRCGTCHSFVRDGRIEFLNDCTHALAGQTVDLPDLAPEA